MKHWIKLTDDIAITIKHNARRKIKLPSSLKMYEYKWVHHKHYIALERSRRITERWARWDASEKCFYWGWNGEDGFYPSDEKAPTYIEVGSSRG